MRLDRPAVPARRRAHDAERLVSRIEVDAARTHGSRLEARERVRVDPPNRLLALGQERCELLLYRLDTVRALERLVDASLLGASRLVHELVAPRLPANLAREARAFLPHREPHLAAFVRQDGIRHEVVPARRARLLVARKAPVAPVRRREVHVDGKSARDRRRVLLVVASAHALLWVQFQHPLHRRLVANAVEPEPLQVVVARHLLVEPLQLRNVSGSVLVALEFRGAVPDGRGEVVRLTIYKKMPFLRDGERRVLRIELVFGKSVKWYERIEAKTLGIEVFVGRSNGSGQNNGKSNRQMFHDASPLSQSCRGICRP